MFEQIETRHENARARYANFKPEQMHVICDCQRFLYANMTPKKNMQRETMKRHIVWYDETLRVKILSLCGESFVQFMRFGLKGFLNNIYVSSSMCFESESVIWDWGYNFYCFNLS